MINVECECGKSIPVEKIETDLMNEDYTPVTVQCECGERYEVSLHMSFLGKDKGVTL
jgi:hypothetical protein